MSADSPGARPPERILRCPPPVADGVVRTELAESSSRRMACSGEVPTLSGMSRLWLLALGSAAVTAAAVLVARANGAPAGPLEWVFTSALLFALAVAIRFVVIEGLAAAAARNRSSRLRDTRAGELARQAVVEERRRLDADIAHQLRTVVRNIADEAGLGANVDDPPDPDSLAHCVEQVQTAARRATSELRRQIGLVRETGDEEFVGAEQQPQPVKVGVQRFDVVLGVSLAVVATLETVVYSRMEGVDPSFVLLLITALAASLVMWRRTAPGPAAVALAVCFIVAWAMGQRVSGGFWCLVTFGGLLWAVGADRRRWAGRYLVGPIVVALIGTVSWLADRDNAGMLVVIAAAGWLGGLLAGRARRSAQDADADSALRRAALERARQVAVAAERRAFAREIHDVVSHAVGVIAVQASAAEVLLSSDPAGAARSLRVIADTARRTLTEMERGLPTGAQTGHWSANDINALAQRIRAAGTPVHLRLDAWADQHADAVYRIVQESLTNVVRHARGAPVQVHVTTVPGGLRILIEDDGAAADATHAERGYGLIGLAERVSAAGGTLTAGPGPSGRGFTVEAVLPIQAVNALSGPG